MKRVYEKPAVERVSLAGEETAAVPNCKRSAGGGGKNQITNPCAIPACKNARGS